VVQAIAIGVIPWNDFLELREQQLRALWYGVDEDSVISVLADRRILWEDFKAFRDTQLIAFQEWVCRDAILRNAIPLEDFRKLRDTQLAALIVAKSLFTSIGRPYCNIWSDFLKLPDRCLEPLSVYGIQSAVILGIIPLKELIGLNEKQLAALSVPGIGRAIHTGEILWSLFLELSDLELEALGTKYASIALNEMVDLKSYTWLEVPYRHRDVLDIEGVREALGDIGNESNRDNWLCFLRLNSAQIEVISRLFNDPMRRNLFDAMQEQRISLEDLLSLSPEQQAVVLHMADSMGESDEHYFISFPSFKTLEPLQLAALNAGIRMITQTGYFGRGRDRLEYFLEFRSKHLKVLAVPGILEKIYKENNYIVTDVCIDANKFKELDENDLRLEALLIPGVAAALTQQGRQGRQGELLGKSGWFFELPLSPIHLVALQVPEVVNAMMDHNLRWITFTQMKAAALEKLIIDSLNDKQYAAFEVIEKFLYRSLSSDPDKWEKFLSLSPEVLEAMCGEKIPGCFMDEFKKLRDTQLKTLATDGVATFLRDGLILWEDFVKLDDKGLEALVELAKLSTKLSHTTGGAL